MPPKKDSKKQAQAKPDNSGIAKQDVEFKFKLTFKSDATELPGYAIMFQWFGGISDKLQRCETGLFETWKKQENVYSFEKECDIIRVDDDFCKNITSKKFYIYFVNAEDNKVEDTLMLDYGSLLMCKEGIPQFKFQSDIIKILNVDSFSLELIADKPLLGDVYRHYLNPFEVEVIGAKDMPIEKSSKYEPSYVKYKFFDGTVVETSQTVGTDKLLWSHKHVFLAGFMNSQQLKEKMRSKYLKFEIHDRDEINNKNVKPEIDLFDIKKAIEEELEKDKPVQEDPKKKGAKKEDKKQVKKEAKKDAGKKKDLKLGEPILSQKKQKLANNFGVSAFYLVQFLKPSMRNAKYKAAVVPKNSFEDFQSRNIDLNTTARNQMQKVISSNNYFDCDTILVVGFTLSYPIGTFVKPEIKEQPVAEDPKKKKEVSKEEPPKVQSQPIIKKDIFERLIYVVPYKDTETIKKIENIFYNINLKAFNLKSIRQLTTFVPKKEEKESLTLDYVTGFQLVDPEGRIYIIQGLKQGSMKQFNKQFIKVKANSKDFKIFKNSKISFTERLFSSFSIEIKRIRLRLNLSHLLLDPSIYIKSKIAEEICQNLNKLSDMRKLCDDLATVDSMNLWPQAQWLLQIERKFSQSLSHEDLYGQQSQKSKKKPMEDKAKPEHLKSIRLMENTEIKYFTADQFFLPKLNQTQNSTFRPVQDDINANTHKKFVKTKTFTKDGDKQIKTFEMRGKVLTVPEKEQVSVYAGQKNNIYDKQIHQLREKMQQNPNVLYTYSKDYLRLHVDPYSQEEERKRQKQISESKMYSKDKFSSLLVKTKQQRMKLPKKPSDSDIKWMIQYPYYQQKDRQIAMKQNERDRPAKNSQGDFKKYLKKQDVFSNNQPLEAQKVSYAQQERINKEKKQKIKEQQQKKRKGQQTLKIKKGYFADKSYGIDRVKDIRQGSPNKIGFIDVNKKNKSKRPVEQYEASMYLKEKINDPQFNPLIRRDDPTKNVNQDEFNFYQRKEILTNTHIFKPLKDIL